MRKFRRILIGAALIGQCTFAATTKVGNGDDGGDLESLTPITDGPIATARAQAVENLRKLNIAGVPGLGQLLPELQRTDLLLAKQDTHPTGEQAGSIEISDDSRLVYARTFAEPYAATRFFPAAEKLSEPQLIALHIHEALHRALPPELRTNENIVMHMTLALTSPGASFDRAYSVANLYIHPPTTERAATMQSSLSLKPESPLPERSKSNFIYSVDHFGEDYNSYGGTDTLHGLEFRSSLGGYQKLAGTAIEPVIRARLKMDIRGGGLPLLSASSLELQGRFKIDDEKTLAPFLRFTTKAIDDDAYPFVGDRDVTTIGGLYRFEGQSTYLDSAIFYSLPSSSSMGQNYYGAAGATSEYKSILSLTAHSGFRLGHFILGGLGEFHASQGIHIKGHDQFNNVGEADVDAFRLLVLGPELGLAWRNIEIKAYGKWLMNETQGNLSLLGDVMDRGAGKGGVGTSLSAKF